MNSRDVLAKAAQPATPVNFDVPGGACDCHTHIHADPEKFPFFAGRVYTPEPASPQEMSELHRALNIERVVIVTPSVYGTDNSATLFGMRARGATARGVAVIDDKTPESDLDAMQKDGFRGIRLNLATSGINDPNVAKQRFQAAVDRIKARGWHVQLYTTLPLIAAIKELVLASPVPAVFDHFGGADAALGVEQPGFSDLVDLVRAAIDQKPAVAPDLAAQRAHRIADAAAKREFCQCRRCCRTREADGHGQLDTARVERGKKAKKRRGLEAELGDDIDVHLGLARPVPPGLEPHECGILAQIGMAFRVAGDTDMPNPVRLQQPGRGDIAA